MNKNLLITLVAFGLIGCSVEKEATNKELAKLYGVSVKKVEQCQFVWRNTDYRYDNTGYLLGYIERSWGIFGFFKPSCDGTIKAEFENYKSAFLSAPINGQTSQECENWRSDNFFGKTKKRNCLLEDFIYYRLEDNLSIEDISNKNASENIAYIAKIEQEKKAIREEYEKGFRPCHPSELSNIDRAYGIKRTCDANGQYVD